MKSSNTTAVGPIGPTACIRRGTFRSHDRGQGGLARRAAGEQRVSGDEVGISWEDEAGHWHNEIADGRDRPETEVEG